MSIGGVPTVRNSSDTNRLLSKESKETITNSAKTTIDSIKHGIGELIMPTRAKVGELVSKNEFVSEKKLDIQGKIDKGMDAFKDVKSHLASEGLITKSTIMSSVKKSIGERIDFILANKTIRNLLKSIVMTNTRIKPEDILKTTDNKAQKKEWEGMIKDMKLTHRNGKESNTLRVSQENLDMIQNRLETLDKSGNTDAATSSEIALCRALIKEYRPRMEIKRNYHEVFKAGAKIGSSLLSDLSHDDFESPQTMMLGMVTACKDDSELRGHLSDMVTNPDNPLRKVLVAAAGDPAVHGLKLALSDPGLAIATALIKVGGLEMASSFLTDPVGTIMNHRAQLGEAAVEVCDQFVKILNTPELADTLVAMSDGKLQTADIEMLKGLVPLMKDLVSDQLSPSVSPAPNETGAPSIMAQKLAQMAGIVATRCDVELARLSPPGSEPLPVGKVVTSLVSTLNSSVAFLVSTTMGSPDAIALPPQGEGSHSVSDESEKLGSTSDHSVEEKPQTWGQFGMSWFTAVADVSRDLVANTLGHGAAEHLDTVIDVAESVANKVADATDLVVDTASYVKEKAVDTAIYAKDVVVDTAIYAKDVVVEMATDRVVGLSASKIAGSIDKKIDQLGQSANGVGKAKGPEVQLTLNTEKLTEFMAQSVGMLSHFVAENPAVLDTIGGSAMGVLGTALDVLNNPSMDRTEKAAVLATSLKDNLGQIGEAVKGTGGPDAQMVGETLMNISVLLGSDLVQRSLAQSKAMMPETMTQVSHVVQSKFEAAVIGGVTKGLDKAVAPKSGLEVVKSSDTSVGVPKSAADLIHADRSAMTLGGVVGSVLKFIGPDVINNGLGLAREMSLPPKSGPVE